MSEQCKRTSKRTSKWPSAHVSIHGSSEPQCCRRLEPSSFPLPIHRPPLFHLTHFIQLIQLTYLTHLSLSLLLSNTKNFTACTLVDLSSLLLQSFTPSSNPPPSLPSIGTFTPAVFALAEYLRHYVGFHKKKDKPRPGTSGGFECKTEIRKKRAHKPGRNVGGNLPSERETEKVRTSEFLCVYVCGFTCYAGVWQEGGLGYGGE